MLRSRSWLLALFPLLIVAVTLTQLLVWSSSAGAQGLSSFASCGDLLQYFREQQEEQLKGQSDFFAAESEQDAFELDDAMADEGVAQSTTTESSAESTPSDGGEVSDTGTNVQERGIDEADIVKTDGRRIYILRQLVLVIAEVQDEGPVKEIARYWFDRSSSRQELLLGEKKLLIVRQLAGRSETKHLDVLGVESPLHPIERYRDQTEVLEIDVRHPWNPQLVRELDVDGRYLTARLVDGDVRIVFHHRASFPIVFPWQFVRDDSEAASEYNEVLADETGIGDVMPLFGFRNHINSTTADGLAVDCDRVYAPEDGHHQDLSFMISFDLKRGMSLRGSVGMLSNEPTVYASTGSLYLAAPDYDSEWNTQIHRFDVADPIDPTYYGSGEVRGHLLSQWAMSEHDGYLRVATTIRDRWPSLSNVFILEPRPSDLEETAGSLEQVGLLSGLGVTEEIFAVRFSGDIGYVVTFRQTDPLYVLDLSDPTDPESLGELKIPGFSRYLHPLGDNLLLGIGRDADERTGRALGLQASLFDVSDPTKPVQKSVISLGDDAQSPVESDHRAFRYQDGIAWIPVGPSDWSLWDQHDGGVLGIEVNELGLWHTATLRVQGEALRAIPIDDQIHVLSSHEVRSFDANNYNDDGHFRFAEEWDLSWKPLLP